MLLEKVQIQNTFHFIIALLKSICIEFCNIYSIKTIYIVDQQKSAPNMLKAYHKWTAKTASLKNITVKWPITRILPIVAQRIQLSSFTNWVEIYPNVQP